MPAVIVDVLISNVSSALSFCATLKNTAPFVSLSSRCLDFFWNSARLSFCSVIILWSSRPTDASPSSPVFRASPDWNLRLSMTGFEPPFESSMLTVPSMRSRRIVVARYLLLETTMTVTTAAMITAAATHAQTIFFCLEKFLRTSARAI